MESKSPTIVVTGDVCIDWLQWLTKPEDAGLNWKLYAGTHMTAKPEGALLLADFMRTATGITVVSSQLKNIDKIPPTVLLHSNAELDLFPYSSDRRDVDKERRVYRIRRCRGFTEPTTESWLYFDPTMSEGDFMHNYPENLPIMIYCQLLELFHPGSVLTPEEIRMIKR